MGAMMGLETATSISALNALWPLGSDPRSQGDDHLRLIKKVLQADAVRKGGDTMTGTLDVGSFDIGAATGGVRVTPAAGVQISRAGEHFVGLGTASAGSAAVYAQLFDPAARGVIVAAAPGQQAGSRLIAAFNSAGEPLFAVNGNGEFRTADPNSTSTVAQGVFMAQNGNTYIQTPAATADGVSLLRVFHGSTNTFKVTADGTTTNSTGAIGSISDPAVKRNIAPATAKLADLLRLKVINYELGDIPEAGKLLGFDADNVAQVFPRLVRDDPEGGPRSVVWSPLVPALVKAVQELAARVSQLEAGGDGAPA